MTKVFIFLIDAFLLFPVACKLSFEAFLERLSLKTSLFRKHSMIQYFVYELTQANLKQGIRRYRKNKSVVPFHFSIKVFKFTQLCINSRTDKLYTSENCRTLTVLKKKGLPLELVNSFLITTSSQQCFSLISFMMFSAFFNRFVIVCSCVVWRSRSLSEMG